MRVQGMIFNSWLFPDYESRLTDNFGIEILVPNDAQRQAVHNIIYDELCLGIISDESRQCYLTIIA